MTSWLMTSTTQGRNGGATLPEVLTERAAAARDVVPGHGYRTALVARQLAQQLVPGISAEWLEHVDTAARAHELGAVLAPHATAEQQAGLVSQYLGDDGGSSVLQLLTRDEAAAGIDTEVALLRRALQVAVLIDRGVTAGMLAGDRLHLAVGDTLDNLRWQLTGADADALAESLLLMYALSGLTTTYARVA